MPYWIRSTLNIAFSSFFSITQVLASTSLTDEIEEHKPGPQECQTAHDLPTLNDDDYFSLMKLLPAKVVTRMGLSNKTNHGMASGIVKRRVRSMTLNQSAIAEHIDPSFVAKGVIEENLQDLLGHDKCILLPLNSKLRPHLPSSCAPLTLEDLRKNDDSARTLYHAAFGRDWPEAQSDLAYEHLMAILSVNGVFIDSTNHDKGVRYFFQKKIDYFKEYLQKQATFHRYVSLHENNKDLDALNEIPHTLVVTDKQMANKDFKERLTDLLEIQSQHRVLLSVGESAVSRDGTLTMGRDFLPYNLHLLHLTNARNNVKLIEQNFLANSINLDSVNFTGFMNLEQIGPRFLSRCTYLRDFQFLGAPRLTRIGDSFLEECEYLKKADLSNFHGLERIGQWFLSWCSVLTTVDLGPSPKLSQINHHFLHGSWLLTKESEKKIKALLKSRHLKWL
ncbi:MAG: leucine-rich repeat protein [Holosporales bacterium]